MKVMSVVGARPQFVKLAPVAEAFAEAGIEHVIVHTGQHYDPGMSAVFFADLRIPAPDVQLTVGSASHGAQTGAMLAQLEEVMQADRPDWVLVYGDTNSTVAAALAAVKIHLPVAHLEAGLRSFNRAMPEEHNRVLTDHAADLLLAPTQVAMGHLADEGLQARSLLVGDVMTDVCFRVRDQVYAGGLQPVRGHAPGEFLVCTIHRAENTDSPDRLRAVVAALADVPAPVILLAHPRLRARGAEFGIDLEGGSLEAVDPLPYPEMVSAVMSSRGVITDSGGLQKEAFLLERTCTTLRTETEWTETLADDWNVLLPSLQGLGAAAMRAIPERVSQRPYGTGDASRLVARALQQAGSQA